MVVLIHEISIQINKIKLKSNHFSRTKKKHM
jgi:hypothetical protein